MGRYRASFAPCDGFVVGLRSYEPSSVFSAGIFSSGGVSAVLDQASFSNLTPTYIAQPPKTDGWGKFMRYAHDAAFNHYRIISYGRDGATTGIACGTTTDFNDDIVYVDGSFIQWPEGTQQ